MRVAPDFIARRREEDGEEQSLLVHLTDTAELARQNAKAFGGGELAYCCGLLHDIGKYSQAFVKYLRESGKRGSVIHSTQGAKYIYQACQDWNYPSLIAEILAVCIAGHHGGLMDGISPDGETPLLNSLSKSNDVLHYAEVVTAFKGETVFHEDIGQHLLVCEQELNNLIGIGKEKKLNLAFMVHMLTKFLFSCLVDADRYNAYCFDIKAIAECISAVPPWDMFARKLETYLESKASETEISRIRQDISVKCLHAAQRPRGIYKLEVPTGGGKTLSSLRFAIAHAIEHDIERIIYIIPYLSILDQTARDIRTALQISSDDTTVLEHHSNLIPSDNDEEMKETRLLTSRWDAPIVITTLVQFLESIYSEKSGKLRKLHSMANAVFIFDEVQSLPVKCVHLFNEAINFLSAIGGSTILLCTATQPLLERVDRPIKLSNIPELIQNVDTAFEKLKRTRIVDSTISGGYSLEQLRDFVLEKAETAGNCLVILNTKADVAKLYDALKNQTSQSEAPFQLTHLSTMMCPEHRLKVLNKLKEDLPEQRVICVSTQLIEAGVDISFGCVVRALAGLDSIAQAAGRCNRNGEDPDGREVYIVNLAEENLSKLPDICCGRNVTKRILEESYEDLLATAVLERYYKEYFYKRKNEMDYSIRDYGTLYDLLSLNQQGCGAYVNAGGKSPPELRQAFQTAGELFCVIEQNTTDVLVPYGRGTELAEEYKSASLREKPKLLREMGQYSVALYPYQIRMLEDEQALGLIADDMLVLNKQYYDEERGVVFSREMEFLVI